MKLKDAVNIVRKEIVFNKKMTPSQSEALASLMIHAMESMDKEVKTWACECDCYAVDQIMCIGEYGVDRYSKQTCPYYSPEDK